MKGVNIAGVQFRRAGRIYDFLAGEHLLRAGDQVVVETERGPSVARVAQIKFADESSYEKGTLKPVLRLAGRGDLEDRGRLNADKVESYAKERVAQLKLDMRVLMGEVQFGGNKAIVYFTAPGRVDFRELVKELATGLKTRVELKQVGPRDETKLLGGIGICGREFCCSSFLRDFVPVSIRMAKNQNLALNPSKVSGGCGRLLCCLTYENDTYKHLRKQLPPKGTRVKFGFEGEERIGDVVRSDILNQLVVVENEEGQQETIPAKLCEVIKVKKSGAGKPKSDPKGSKAAEEAEAWAEDIDLEALEEEKND